MEVTILNPEVLQDLYKNHGEFACICYDTPTKYAEKVGKSCQANGHMSGSRCEYIKFHISGVDRGTAEQCLRHEIGVDVPIEYQDNYSGRIAQITDVNPNSIVKNMASFRYIDKAGFTYTTPKEVEGSKRAKLIYDTVMGQIEVARCDLKRVLSDDGVDEKRVNECVNFILPRCTESEFVIGFTPEALIHFMHKRLCSRAQPEIRKLANLMRGEVDKVNPKFAEALVPHCKYLLWCPEGKMSCGAYPTRNELVTTLKQKG